MNVLMPQLGETVAEGTIGNWLKQVGDYVQAGEALVEIETDKATMEVEATQSGILSTIHVAEGESASVGAVIAVISKQGQAATAERNESANNIPERRVSGGGEDILMPQLGETVAEGTISKWFKSAGDKVTTGEPLFEVETDKATMEVEATSSGKLSEIFVKEGQTTAVGTRVARIGNGGSVSNAHQSPAVAVTRQVNLNLYQPASEPASGHLDPFNEVKTPVIHFGRAELSDGMKITPVARRLLQQNGLDALALGNFVRAQGANRISKKEVLAVLSGEIPLAKTGMAHLQAHPVQQERPAFLNVVPGPADTVMELNRYRKLTAERLAVCWQTIPHVYQAVEINFRSVEEVRDRYKTSFKDRHDISLTYLPFIIRATSIALQEFPQVNAKFDGEKLIVCKDINIGIAVDLDHKGLVVPVLHHADEMSVSGIARALHRLAQKARDEKLPPADFEGGTYTISNNGSFGTLFTTPIINAPQVAILSTDAIRKRPTVIRTDEGDKVVPELVGTIGQCFDHRAFDGAYSARFLNHLKEVVETRDWSGEFN